tara:strand:+ start:110 stop:262 length:153 start_codon:yes stop_codon:yes gene_type:complete
VPFDSILGTLGIRLIGFNDGSRLWVIPWLYSKQVFDPLLPAINRGLIVSI